MTLFSFQSNLFLHDLTNTYPENYPFLSLRAAGEAISFHRRGLPWAEALAMTTRRHFHFTAGAATRHERLIDVNAGDKS
jgi:hypothetical protein